jgi:hypothetical protein
MPAWLQIALRISAGLFGALLLYGSFFLYEDEFGRLTNFLETWWVRIDDMQRGVQSMHTAFMLEVSRIAAAGYERLFGKKLISRRAFSVSICYSVASCSFFLILLLQVTSIADPLIPRATALTGIANKRDMIELLAVAALFYLGLGTYPAFVKPSRLKDWLKWVNKLALFPLIGISFLTADVFKKPAVLLELIKQPWRYEVVLFLLCSFLCDLIVIIITRRVLLWCSRGPNFTRIAAMVLSNLSLGVVLVVGPLALPDKFKIMGALNIVDALAALVFFGIALLMLLHKLFWPLLSRAIYIGIAHGSGRSRRVISSIGFVLIFYALGLLHIVAARELMNLLK